MAELGGTHLELHSPFTLFGSAQAQFRGAELDATTAQTVENLAPVVAEAAAPKCVLVWENIFDLRTDPFDGLVATFESSWVRRSIDTGHAHLMTARGGPPTDTWVRAGGEPGARAFAGHGNRERPPLGGGRWRDRLASGLRGAGRDPGAPATDSGNNAGAARQVAGVAG